MFSQLDVSCVDQYNNSRYSRLLRYCGVKPAASGPASSTSAGAAPGGGGSNASSTATTPTASTAPTAAQPPAAAADPAPASQAGCRTKQIIVQTLLYAPCAHACASPACVRPHMFTSTRCAVMHPRVRARIYMLTHTYHSFASSPPSTPSPSS